MWVASFRKKSDTFHRFVKVQILCLGRPKLEKKTVLGVWDNGGVLLNKKVQKRKYFLNQKLSP